MTRYRVILHATDFSPASRRAFAMALEWAVRDRAQLVVVNVAFVPVPPVEDAFITARTYRDLAQATIRDAERRLERLVATAKARGVKAAAMVLEGIAFEAIVQAARSRQADLVVVGTHGRSGLRRFVLGSVAERVIGLAPCPVLTVPSR
jgi:nucleotide-binding universal stress UspA family protein